MASLYDCFKKKMSQLDLFSKPKVANEIQESFYTTIQPTTAITNSSQEQYESSIPKKCTFFHLSNRS